MPDFNKFYNGQGKSRFDQEGFDQLTNVDVWSEVGSIKCRLALAADTTTNAPNEPCVQATAPTGTQYFFSTTSGKIWKRATAGTYSVITANANEDHRGAQYYNGYIYYWTATKLGRFVYDTEASRNNSFGTFTNGNAYGSCEENLTLFIADGKYVASVNTSGTFSANALDIPAQYTGTCLIPDGYTNILIGTIIGSKVQLCRAFLWDTYSDSFTLSDEIPEVGINCFINADETIIAQCGIIGKLYEWTGQQFVLFDNDLHEPATGGYLDTTTGHQMSVVLNGRPLLAVGTKIFSIFRRFKGFGRAIAQEYTATDTITSIDVSNSVLLVSTTTSVNKLGTDRAIATIDTPEVAGNFNNIIVDYQELPTGIGIQTKINGGSWTAQTPIVDSVRNKVYFDGGLADCNYTQARVIMTPSAGTTPVITNISIV